MLMLVITVVFGIIFAVFATQNPGSAPLYFGPYSFLNVPIYLIILIPLLIGLFISFLIHLLKSLTNSLTISEHQDEIKNLKKDLTEITKEAHQLELENTRLKAKTGEFDENSI